MIETVSKNGSELLKADNGIYYADLSVGKKSTSYQDIIDNFPIGALQSNIIIKPQEAEDKSEGGIIIAHSVKERPSKGWVVSMGEDLKDKPVKIGTLVHHVKGAGVEVEYNKESYYIMRYTDLLCYDK